MTEKTIEKPVKIDPASAVFKEVPDRLKALEIAVAEVQQPAGKGWVDRLIVAEERIAQLERLLIHHHQMRSGMLNYVDKPVLIKNGSFVPLNAGSEPSR